MKKNKLAATVKQITYSKKPFVRLDRDIDKKRESIRFANFKKNHRRVDSNFLVSKTQLDSLPLQKKLLSFVNNILLLNFSIKQLISANAHLGYEINRWNPHNKSFLWGIRNNMHILNIQETSLIFRRVFAFTTGLIKVRKLILFASENKHIDHVLKKLVLVEQLPIATNRWIGGIITNFKEIKKNVRLLTTGYNTKIKYNLLSNRRKKLKLSLEGLVHFNQIPSLVVVLNGVKSKWVINEVISNNIPCAAVIDSVANSKVHFPIPGNVYGFATQVLYIKLFLILIKNARLQEILTFRSIVTPTTQSFSPSKSTYKYKSSRSANNEMIGINKEYN